jgi:hypothetical protein
VANLRLQPTSSTVWPLDHRFNDAAFFIPKPLPQQNQFGNLYLANYANEAAYREDTRRMSNGDIFDDISEKCATTPTSRDWCGYWQGNKRDAERLVS